ncbi:MAG TPA: UDP-N-acetylmuramoyl-L-alanyl-D-glutamate--2,6-diaminopimelate ligase [Clostridia bacterium]|nr:UDP-N-acetylmuramoyl-L-alanyl-D-glutamate--2,6-diaminopimelate ligase [Clostridia bacterium]
MQLRQLAKATAYARLTGDAEIQKIEYNSKRVERGDLFCCVVGTFFDGHDYAVQAAEAGAAALVVERQLEIDLPQLVVPNTRVAMAELAAMYYGDPSREMKMVGVTGTNGKTSTTYMVKAIAEQAGCKVGLIGTIRNLIGERVIETERTTPESVDLQRILREMKDEGVELVVMEVSSHSLDQHRVHGIDYDVGVFTNLTHDHLDYHKTFDNYLAAKKKLFSQAHRAVLNADDPYFARMAEGLSIPVTTFGIRENADFSASDIDITPRGVQFDMRAHGRSMRLNIAIPGLFSAFNALGAAAAASLLGFKDEDIKLGLERMKSVSGRLEPLPTNGRDFTVLLDYAHAPDALENVLTTIRGFAKGRIITLFGCGGDRDHAKRPIMGEIAGRYSDFLVVTSDNPRSEDPYRIIDAVMEGVMKSGCAYVVIEDRYDAIKYAVEHAGKDDIVLLAGKGHENYQEVGGGKRHFDEKEIVAELLKEPAKR